MRAKLIFNPAAGRGRAARRIDRVVEVLGSRLERVEECRSAAHLTEIAARAASEGIDRLVVCGGDGTLHHAIRRLDLDRVSLGIIPLGSGDDFARSVGIPRDLDLVCETAVGESTRRVDVGIANGTRFLGVAGVGFDSEVARYASRVRGIPRSILYLYSIFRVLPQFRPRCIAWSIGGRRFEEEIMFAVVGNTERYGGGIRIAPRAVIDDGQLDFYVVHRCSRIDLVLTLPLAYVGKHTIRKYVTSERVERIEIEARESLEVFADGEFVTSTPVTFEVAAQRLSVAVPRVDV